MYYQVNMHYGLENHSPTQEVVWLTFNFTTCQHHDMRDEASFDRMCSKFSERFVGGAPTSAGHLTIVLLVQHSCFEPCWFESVSISQQSQRWLSSIKHRLVSCVLDSHFLLAATSPQFLPLWFLGASGDL